MQLQISAATRRLTTKSDSVFYQITLVSVLHYTSEWLQRVRLRSHRHECEYESESGFPFTGCLSLVQASAARMERSLVQAHNSTRVY